MRAGRPAADALARGGKGRVVSVHRRAVNLRLEGGAIVALLPAGTPLHPWAIGGEIPLSEIEVGDEVVVSEGLLRVGGIEIGLGDLQIEDLAIQRRPTELERVRGLSLSATLGPGVGTPRPSASGSSSEPWDQELAQALSEFSATSDPAFLARLVGLGGGLTPSGDDVIVGALAALDLISLAVPEAEDARTNLVQTLSRPLHAHTPRLSAQMLEAAIDGQYPEPLVRLCEAITAGDPEAIERATGAVMALGHRSGADMLRGFVAARGGLGTL